MRVTALLGIVLIAAGCSTKEAAPPADTTSASVEPAPPPALSLESVAGTWNVRVMAMDKDSTLTTNVLTASADPAGWSMVQASGNKVVLRNVTVAGDSITVEASGFKSGVVKGVTVKDLHTTYRLQDGKLVGTTTAHYDTKGADSVRTFRLEGTKQ